MNAAMIPFATALITVVIETLILALAGYRTRIFIAACALINLATNLTLNAALSFTGESYFQFLLPAELAVVLIEWAVLSLVADHGHPVRLFSWPSLRLFLFVLLANIVTFTIGVVLTLTYDY